jgi:hypothetical protein
MAQCPAEQWGELPASFGKCRTGTPPIFVWIASKADFKLPRNLVNATCRKARKILSTETMEAFAWMGHPFEHVS